MVKYKILLFALVTILSCGITNSNFSIFNPGLLDYYSNVNQAENYILDGLYNDAIKHYEIAFSNNYSFPVDYYNAFMASLLIKNEIKSKKYLNKLAEYGAIKEWLRNKANDTIFFDKIAVDFNQIRSLSVDSNMLKFSSFFDDLFQQDQNCRDGSITTNELLEECDDNVMLKLYNFIDKYGFPTFEKIGVFGDFDLTGFRDMQLDMILIHQRSYTGKKIEKIAFDAVQRGEYDVRSFIRFTDYQSNELLTRIPTEPISKEELKEINKRRTKFGLFSVEDYMRRIDYHRNNLTTNKFYFVSFWDYGINFNSELKIIE